MPDYNLNGLDVRTFQHLIQAIAIKEVGPGVIVYGDGRDGARDATFRGQTAYPSTSSPWNGYLIIQAKYRQKSTGDTKNDGAWAHNQLTVDLEKFISDPKQYRAPEYYIFATNVDLTATPETGTEARVRKLLDNYAPKLGLKGYDIWDGNKIRRYLDSHRDIATTYGGYITTGDVLARMRSWIDGLQPNFDQVAADYLQGELVADQYARLREAGSASERKTPLARVFVDLPVAEEANTPPASLPQPLFFSRLITNAGSLRMDRKSIIDRHAESGRGGVVATPEDGRFVLIGGPGQGKSTLGQFVCQIYRAAILKDRPLETLSETTQDALDTLLDQCRADNIEIPTSRRFPVRIDLKHFADSLAKTKCISVIDYVAQRIDSRSGQPIDRNDLQKWLSTYPWLVVLDGLDEVPASSNRNEVLDSIAQFSAQCATRGADILIIATSRPQGYGDAFERRLYCHRYLLPLSTDQALHYAQRLVENLHPAESDLRGDVMSRLKRAAGRISTERLMRTPLQVTIMAILAELSGELPDDRWELFRNYYRTIFDRETQRGIIPLSSILSKYRRPIDRIHRRTGLQLQVLSELAGHNNAALKQSAFINLILGQLQNLSVDDSERTWATEQLAKAALDRLVFLVSPREDEIGFEIRSLQEFMAAEALMEGTDEQIRKRLASIAPYPHWRNVLLFAASKCASEREYMIADLVVLCQSLSDASDPEASATMAGARLALDMLEDDTFREHPKEHRILAETALRLLELPLSEEHTRLGHAFRPNRGLEPVYLQAIRRELRAGSLERQASAWATTLTLISRNQEWAIGLAEEFWPSDTEQQLRLLRLLERPLPSPWLLSKYMLLVPLSDPFDLGFRAIYNNGPAWLKATKSALQEFGKSPLPIVIVPNNKSILHFEINEWLGARAERYSDVADMPNPSRKWQPVTAYARIFKNPTRETIYRELVRLADNGWPAKPEGNLAESWDWLVGWPLSTCLKAANSPVQLREIAECIKTGDLEGPDQYHLLERKWRTEGIRLTELLTAIDSPGFSFRTAWLHMPIDTSHRSLVNLAPAIRALTEHYTQFSADSDPTTQKKRYYLATLIAQSFYWPVNLNDRTSAQAIRNCITPSLLEKCIADSSTKWVSLHAIDLLISDETIPEPWVDTMNRIGLSDIRLLQHTPRGVGLHKLQGLAAKISRAYAQDKTKIGLLRWLATLGSQGVPLTRLPRHLSISDLDEKSQGYALLIALSSGSIAPSAARTLAQRFSRLHSSIDWLKTSTQLTRMLRHCLSKPWISTFLVELAITSQCDTALTSASISLLNELLSERKSPLHSRESIVELGLADLMPG